MKILFVRMSCIGDILHATPTAKALKKAIPDCHIVWIVTPSFAPIIEQNPYVDEILLWERDDFEKYARQGKIKTLWKMWWLLRDKLRTYDFDLAIDVQGLLISGLVMLASGAKRKIGMGNTKELNKFFVGKRCQEPYTHVIDRYLQVLHLIDIYDNDTHMVLNLSEEENTWADTTLKTIFTENLDKPLIGLVPGTSWPSKEWLPEYWQELANILKNDYRLVYLGGKQEIAIAETLPTGPQIYNAVGRTSLRETAALINQTGCVVSADTGSLHMAVALDRPTISFYGPTNPNKWGPIGEKHRILQASRVTCLCCRKRKCPKPGHPCMVKITPEKVKREIAERIVFYGKV